MKRHQLLLAFIVGLSNVLLLSLWHPVLLHARVGLGEPFFEKPALPDSERI